MKINQLLKMADRVILLMAGFWVGETVFFLIRDGWHWKAETTAELICDNIVAIMFWIAAFILLFACFKAIRIVAKIEEKEDTP